MGTILEFSTILVELDCLLDTRLGILSELGDDKLQKVISMYHTRDIDEFPYYGFNKFKTNYDKRDKSILVNSLLTPVMGLVTEFVNKTLLQVTNSPFHFQPKVMINIHPYDLTEEEVNNLIQMVVLKTNKRCDVEVVSKNIGDLTIGYVKDNISIMVMYEYYKWIEYHSVSKSFSKLTCPDINLFAPGIYFKPKQLDNSIIQDPINSMEEIAKPLIGLKLFPIEYFSFIKPNKNKST